MKLSDKVKILRPTTTSREFLNAKNGIKCIHYGDVYKNYSGKTINSSSIINCYTKIVPTNKLFTCDSIIVPDVTETVADWGHFVYVRYDGTPYINGTHTFALTCDSIITLQYLFCFLSSERNRFRFQSLLNGSTVFQISLSNFNSFELQNYHNSEQSQQHIVDIIEATDKIKFVVEIDIGIKELDTKGYPLEFLSNSNLGKTTIGFEVSKVHNNDEDDSDMSDIVPFQIAYAVSIHKSQGLEYDSVKIAITNEVEERITHNIFYTAITRARKNLMIYWSPETSGKSVD